jgi:ketosteroid isomerase-like protein
MIGVFALVVLLLVDGLDAACQLTPAAMKSVVNAYQAAQNNLDAKATANLFTVNAKLYMPVGVGQPYEGRASILAAYTGYFNSLQSTNETLTSQVILSGSIAAYSKSVSSVSAMGQSSTTFVISWFNMTCNFANRAQVTSLSHAWNN